MHLSKRLQNIFSSSSFVAYKYLLGRGTLGGIWLVLTEIGPILPDLDRLGCGEGVVGCGMNYSILAVVLS